MPAQHEVQFDAQRRRRIVSELLADRKNPQIVDGPTEEIDLGDLYADFQLDLERGGRQVARGKDGTKILSHAFDRFDAAYTYYRTLQLRPDRNRGRFYLKIVLELRQAYFMYISSLGAKTLEGLQDFNVQGDECMQRAQEYLSELVEFEKLYRLQDSDSALKLTNDFGRQLRQEIGPVSNVQKLDSQLRAKSKWRQLPEWSGIGVQQAYLFAAAWLDIDSFTDILLKARQLTNENQSFCTGFDTWKRPLAKANLFLAGVLRSLGRTASDPEAAEFEIFMDFIQSIPFLRDGVIVPCLAIFMASDGEKYKAIQKAKGKTVKRASECYPELRLNDNMSPEFRHSGAHADFDLVNGRVCVNQKEVSQEIFIDRFLAYPEVAFAINLGVSIGLMDIDQSVDLTESLSPSDRDSLTGMVLGLYGIECHSLSSDEDEVRIHSSALPEDKIALLGFLGVIYGGYSEKLSWQWEDAGAPHVLLSNLEVWASDSGETEADKLFDLIEVVAATMIDDRSLWSDEQWSKVALHVIARGPEEPRTEWAGRVLRLRRIAAKNHIAGVELLCKAAVKKDVQGGRKGQAGLGEGSSFYKR